MSSRSRARSIASQRVVVKFDDRIDLPYEDDVGAEVESRGVGPWREVERAVPGVTIDRLFTEASPREIEELLERARRADATYRPPNFLTYFVVECPGNRDPLEVVRLLRRWRSVETAYVDGELVPTASAVEYADDPLFSIGAQQFLHAAPEGIGSLIHATATVPQERGAWTVPGGEGGADDLRFIDIEQGWKFDHRDLELDEDALLAGDNVHQFSNNSQSWSTSHGTAVLGVVTSNDNDLDGLGVVPNLGSVEAISVAGYGIENALLRAARTLKFGDVALIEVGVLVPDTTENHVKFLPVEVLQSVFDTIRLCTALGIVVVEGAANGIIGQNTGIDLDEVSSLTHSDGQTPLVSVEMNPELDGFEDSGAILVGASKDTSFSVGRHKRADFSNYGARVDCFAWGRGVTTLSTANNGTPDSPSSPDALEDASTGDFGGTSAASAIVAGAALAVQSMAQTNLGYRFSPEQLREVLSREPENWNFAPGQPVPPDVGNTPSNDPETDRIGVMPNLWWIAEDVLALTPNIYIRDHVGDTGDPHDGSVTLWRSPDIFVRPEESADPQAEFGPGSGTENSNTLGAEVHGGQDHYVYVRVKNRGGVDVEDVTATVYYSPPSTLTMGHLWTEIGSVTIPSVPVGDELVVSGAITWSEEAIPDPGHYCFVALVGSEGDPAPEPTDFLDMDGFKQFVSQRNTVAWRNFNVAGPEVIVPAAWFGLQFVAAGPSKESAPMRLDLHARLPRGSRARLELPRRFASRLRLKTVPAEKEGVVHVRLNPHGRTTLGETEFAMGSQIPMELQIRFPKRFRDGRYEVSARQSHEGTEVGRVSWLLDTIDG